MLPAELALRTGAAAILLITGLVMLRDRQRVESGPFGGLLALSVSAYAGMTITGFNAAWWSWPILLVGLGTPALLWTWTGALFVDDFRASWRDALGWTILPAIGAFGLYSWRPWIGFAENMVSCLFILLSAWRTLAGLRGDLVERRRRMRPLLVTLAVLYAGGTLLMEILAVGRQPGTPARVAEAAALAALAAAFALLALRAGRSPFGPTVVVTDAPGPRDGVATAPAIDAQDDALLARLQHLIQEEKIYRQEGFGLPALVAALDAPEYRLRKLINQRLGHRNFSSFVNG